MGRYYMKDKILEQIGKELKLATHLDLVTMVVAVLVTLIFFGIAGGSAGGTAESMSGGLAGGILGGATPKIAFQVTPTIIMFVALIAIVIINCYAVRTLMKNKAQRAKLNQGIVKLFKDETVDQYNDGSIYKTYETRYSLFAVIIMSVAAVSVIVPLVVFINQMTKL
jgi:hypothetical protein